MIELAFQSGTLTLSGCALEALPAAAAACFKADERSGNLRARACDYASIVLALRRGKIAFSDRARNYAPDETLALAERITPYLHQQTALEAWRNGNSRGVISLPTGSGKTILAVLAIAELKRPALVLVPTIDLLAQWASVLEKFFRRPVGMLGGGEHRIETLTVSTYDSAALNIEFIGDRFALLIADECHHLPAPETRLCAAMAIAPFRLGLSATPELDEERSAVMTELMGPVVCDIGIDELEGRVLSLYDVRQLRVELTPEENCAYRRHRAVYTEFLRRNGITFTRSGDWGRFLGLCSRSDEGRAALRSFLEQRRIARAGSAKLQMVEEIFLRHAGERTIIFTADNDTAYEIGRRFLLPVLTHHTKAAERKEFLDRFRSGEYPVLVTSKVLNEGVDVPAAAVGVVVSGSGSVREHVQRLGRILRPAPGKEKAILYELVSAGTSEEGISERRRAHRAYRFRRRG